MNNFIVGIMVVWLLIFALLGFDVYQYESALIHSERALDECMMERP